jgi:hypothetical protein
MVYERYPRSNAQGDDYGRDDFGGYGRDYGSGRDYSYSSARDYQAAGRLGGDRQNYDRQSYGAREYGNQRYEQRDQAYGRGREYYGGRGGYDRYPDEGRDSHGRYDQDRHSDNRYVERSRYGADAGRDRGEREYHGSYGAGGRRFEDFGPYRHADDDDYRGRERAGRDQGRNEGRDRPGYGRQPQGYDYEERGFFARAGDEVRSWFGDEDAERRREFDSRLDERAYNDRDNDYHSWRRGQIQSLDRDYDEYRREHRSKFENEFSSWRTNRQSQRDLLNKVEEHADVVGSDGEHVGTVDKVRGDRILLTKNDADAGGRHHSIPSSWLQSVDDKVTLSKTAAEAKRAWRDEERNQALFGDDHEGPRREPYASGRSASTQSETTGAGASQSSASSSTTASGGTAGTTGTDGDRTLNRSFSGTY